MLVVAAVGVLLSLTAGFLMVVSAVVASHRAQAAADLGALAAAAVLVQGAAEPAACAAGGVVVAHNDATVAGCRTGPDLSVELTVQVAASLPHLGVATARARAGPASALSG